SGSTLKSIIYLLPKSFPSKAWGGSKLRNPADEFGVPLPAAVDDPREEFARFLGQLTRRRLRDLVFQDAAVLESDQHRIEVEIVDIPTRPRAIVARQLLPGRCVIGVVE